MGRGVTVGIRSVTPRRVQSRGGDPVSLPVSRGPKPTGRSTSGVFWETRVEFPPSLHWTVVDLCDRPG